MGMEVKASVLWGLSVPAKILCLMDVDKENLFQTQQCLQLLNS